MPSVEKYLKRHNMSLEQFGVALGVSRGYVHNLVAGRRAPSVQLLRRMHELTSIPVKKLLYECT